jgi:hypothetical protein
VRVWLIRQFLPLMLTLLPIAVGVLIVLAVPRAARDFYLQYLRESQLDWIILGLGSLFWFLQLWWTRKALQWQSQTFDERYDTWLQGMYQAAEWFPLLGLFGTVAAVLQTFGTVSLKETVTQREIVAMYAPALTTTASGLLMAFLNILPAWLVKQGRRLILSLAMPPRPSDGEPPHAAA